MWRCWVPLPIVTFSCVSRKALVYAVALVVNPLSYASKKVKTEDSVHDDDDGDIISNLPNEVLARILSFLPTKSAVATTVLSKRWIRVWMSVPNLDFKSVHFLDGGNGDDDDDDYYYDDSLKNLLSGCPVLKRLCIHQGLLKNKKTLYVFSSTVHELELDTGSYRKYLGYDAVIDAPNLMYMHLIDMVGMAIDMINVSSLVKASLSLRSDDREPSHVYEERLFAFLRKITHVKELILDSTTIRGAQPILSWYEFHEVPRCLLSSLENVEITL